MGFVGKWIRFIRDVASDGRIPRRDKAVLGGCLVMLASPVDLIPDFIPVLGHLDDLVVVIIVLDYVLNGIPKDVLRDHFPGDPAAIAIARRRTHWLTYLVPNWVKRRVWAQQA